ncbi:MAG: hypothetical protein V4568_03370 [Pseudomonadota bacterium]
MSLDNNARSITGRLSLREPQAESLRKLAAALDAVPSLRDHRARSLEDLGAMINRRGWGWGDCSVRYCFFWLKRCFSDAANCVVQ